MTPPSTPQSHLVPLLLLTWRWWLHAAVALCAGLCWGISRLAPWIRSRPGPLAALLDVLLPMRTLAALVLCIYVLWWLAVLIETLVLRCRMQPSPPGVLQQLRLPRPLGTAAQQALSASGVRQAQQEADTLHDALRSMIAALAAGDLSQLSLELWRGAATPVRWAIWSPDESRCRALLRAMWIGAAPGGDLRVIPDPLHSNPSGVLVWAECQLAAPAAYPLRMVDEHTADPLAALLGSLTPTPGVQQLGIQCILTPGPDASAHTRRAHWRAQLLTHAHPDRAAQQVAQALAVKAADPGACAGLRVLVLAENIAAGAAALTTVLALLDSFSIMRGAVRQGWQVTARGCIREQSPIPLHLARRAWPRSQRRIPPPLALQRAPSVLVPAELAALWHLPTARYRQLVDWRANTYLPPDPALLGSVIAVPSKELQ